jgi:acetyltransferase-like isoleucine patch superfamily enzyme
MSVTRPTIRAGSEPESQENRGQDPPVSMHGTPRLTNPVIRTLQRHFVPRIVASLYYFLKYRCLISNQAVVQISDRISFGKGTVVKPFAVIQTQTGRIVIGHHCAVSSFDHLSTGTADLVIGDYVRIGPNVTIMGGSRNFKRRDVLIVEQGSSNPGTAIGDDVLIGANAVILPGCLIGEGAVIGASSLVNKDVPPYAIVAGVPAQVLGERE